MVVYRRCFVLALLLLAPNLWAATLAVHFPTSQLQAGRTVRVEVSSPRLQPSLAGLDLSPWSPWLLVGQRGDVTSNRAGGQTLVLWLVPRALQQASQAGRIRLPPLSLGALRGGGQNISIVPARALKGGEAIVPQFTPPSRRAWLHQQLIYIVSVVSRHRYLQWESEPANEDGFETLSIPPQVEAIGKGRYRHTTGWLLFPSRAGKASLQLPAVRYGRDGVTTHRFYPPPLDLDIRPLPAYLPPLLAVGQVQLQGDGRPLSIVRSGDLQTRHFSVISRGVLAKWWHPPTMVVSDNAVQLYEAAPALRQHIDASGLSVEYRYALPLEVSGSGWYRLTAASRIYRFDPVSGKMKALSVSFPLPLSLYGWQEVLLSLLLAGLLWFGGRRLWRYLQRRRRFLSSYRNILRQLRLTPGAASLRQLLIQVADAEAWPANLSLHQWHVCWRRLQPKQKLIMEAWIDELECGLYAGGECRPGELADSLARALRQRLGLWRWICEFHL